MSYKSGAQRWADKAKGQNRAPDIETQMGRSTLRYRALRGDVSAQVALDEYDARDKSLEKGGEVDD